jgi:hypothetical protein
MRGWVKGPVAATAALTLGACVVPLNITIDDDYDVRVRGSGHLVSVARSVSAFDAVSAEGAMKVIVARTGFEGVTITAEDNLLPYIVAEVRSGVLYVGQEPGVRLDPRREIVVRVESYEVVEVNASAAVGMEVEVGWVPELWVTVSGASDLVVWGSADRQNATVSGASRYDALDLETGECSLDVSGASDALVWARDWLEVDASGASRVRFRGNPVVVARTSGGSTVTRY